MILADGQVETPEIRAQLDLMRIQDENRSMQARAKIKQDITNVAVAVVLTGTAIFVGMKVFGKR